MADLATQRQEIEEVEDPEQRARLLAILQAYDERHRPALVRLFALVQEMGLVSVRDGVVRVKRKGSCVGCPASTFTLRQWVDARLAERMPGYRGLEVVEESRPDELPRRVTIRPDNQPGGQVVIPLTAIEEIEHAEFPVARLHDLEAGRLYSFRIGAVPMLLVRLGDEVRAFIDGCAGSPLRIGVGGVL